jgi:single-strand DNA-binding protein
MGMNLVVLEGRLTKDPELKHTGGDVAFCNFSIAVERDYTLQATGERPTDFFNVIAWRAQAEAIAKFFCKGKLIIVQGQLQTDKYESNGEQRTSYRIKLDKFSFGGDKRKPDDAGDGDFNQDRPEDQPMYTGYSKLEDDEDVPF